MPPLQPLPDATTELLITQSDSSSHKSEEVPFAFDLEAKEYSIPWQMSGSQERHSAANNRSFSLLGQLFRTTGVKTV